MRNTNTETKTASISPIAQMLLENYLYRLDRDREEILNSDYPRDDLIQYADEVSSSMEWRMTLDLYEQDPEFGTFFGTDLDHDEYTVHGIIRMGLEQFLYHHGREWLKQQ